MKSGMKSIDETINLLGLSREQLSCFFTAIEEKPFRVQQLMKWIYHEQVSDFDLMTNLSKSLRLKLKNKACVKAPELVSEDIAADEVCKWTVRSASGSLVETVFIPESGRGTLCISSQVGCTLNCSFCSTGKQGFNSDLTAAEITGQVWQAVRKLKTLNPSCKRPITNVVFMGMGEPLMNFAPVMSTISVLMDDLGFGLSKRRVTLSTSGVVPAIYNMIGRTDVSLAISLHAPCDALRNELVPINKKYPLSELLAAVNAYMSCLADKRVVTIEYTLLAGVNDQQDHALALVKLLAKTPCKINLIPFNTFPGSGYTRPSNNAVRRFQQWLMDEGLNTTIRKTRGDEVSAACGQLVGAVDDRTSRQSRYKERLRHESQFVRIVAL